MHNIWHNNGELTEETTGVQQDHMFTGVRFKNTDNTTENGNYEPENFENGIMNQRSLNKQDMTTRKYQ